MPNLSPMQSNVTVNHREHFILTPDTQTKPAGNACTVCE